MAIQAFNLLNHNQCLIKQIQASNRGVSVILLLSLAQSVVNFTINYNYLCKKKLRYLRQYAAAQVH